VTDQNLTAGSMSRQWGIVALVVGLICGIAAGQFEQVAVAEAFGWSACTITMVWYVFGAKPRGQSFWWFLAAVVIAHSLLVFTVPWPSRYKLFNWDILIGLIDLTLTFATGVIFGRLVQKVKRPPST